MHCDAPILLLLLLHPQPNESKVNQIIRVPDSRESPFQSHLWCCVRAPSIIILPTPDWVAWRSAETGDKKGRSNRMPSVLRAFVRSFGYSRPTDGRKPPCYISSSHFLFLHPSIQSNPSILPRNISNLRTYHHHQSGRGRRGRGDWVSLCAISVPSQNKLNSFFRRFSRVEIYYHHHRRCRRLLCRGRVLQSLLVAARSRTRDVT